MKINSSFPKAILIILLVAFFSSNQKLTALAQNQVTTFAVIGDYGLAGQPEADVANLVKNWNPDFIVTVGDNNYPKGSAESIDQNIGQYYHEFIYPYKGKYGAGATTRRFFPALGNHDWGNNGAEPYYSYFSFFNQRGYYDFIQGPIHFFVLDSDTKEPDETSSTSKQAKWLKSGLTASTSTFNVVVLHHAPYSSGKHGSTIYMQWPYKDWGADVVLAGHDHTYERLLVDNLPYFVNGIGGAELYNFETILPESQARFNSDYGAMRVEATATTMKFEMFTRAGILVDQYIIGQTIPTVSSFTRVNQNLTNAALVDYAITFSEAVTGVDVSDFALSTTNINDASIANISGIRTSYTITLNTGSTDGTLQLKLVDDDSISGSTANPLGGRGAGNGNSQSDDIYITDKTPPAVLAVTRVNANPTNSLSVDYSVSFSESVNGVDGSDFVVFSSNPSGAFISNIAGSGNNYTVSINTGSGDTTLRLDMIDNDTITDIVGNSTNSSFTNGEIYNIDKSTPTVTSIIRGGPGLTNSTNVDFIVTFSEPITGLDSSDFILAISNINGAYISNIANSNPFYIVTVNTGIGDGTIRLDMIDDDSIANALGTSLGNAGAGNGNFSNGEKYTIDKTAPLVTSIQRASTNPSSASSVDFIVTFSEQVSGADSADFAPVTTNVKNAFISNIVNANPFYVVSLSTGTGNGSLRLDLTDNDSIIDAAGNPLGNSGSGNGNFISGDIFTITKESINFPAPVLLEPRRNLLTNNSLPSFSWTLVRNARAYELTIAMDENFSQIIFNQVVNKPSFTPASTFQDGIFYWKVRAYNPDLLPGKYSTTQIFAIDKTPPTPPAPTSPSNNSSSPKRPWLQWTSASDASQFQIEVDDNSNFLNPNFKSTSNKLYVRAEGLLKGVYFWRVKAKDSAGNWSNWSSVFSFTIQ